MIQRRLLLISSVILTLSFLAGICGCTLKSEEYIFGHQVLEPKTNIVLALFDGSEKRTVHENDMKQFLEEPLEKFGFEVQYHDINTAPPPQYIMRNVRAIVSWFKDSKLKNAQRYCLWLDKQMEDGKKIVIIDNFGAYQDLKTLEWTPMHIVNKIFKRIGVIYKAKWTNDPELLEITYKDSSVVEKIRPIDLPKTAHYYFFEKIDEKTFPFLTMRRRDLAGSESQIIFSHPQGGKALSRYILTADTESGYTVSNIDFSRFLQESLFFSPVRNQKVLIVWDKVWDKNKEYIQNTIKTLEYAKIEFDITRLRDLEKFLAPDFKEYTSIILCADRLWTIERKKTITSLQHYVADGGGLLVLNRCENKPLAGVFGIESINDFYEEPVIGLKITAPFFPGSKGLFYPDESFLTHQSLKVDLKGEIDILARATRASEQYPRGIPIAWLNRYGKGRAVYWNSDCMNDLTMRGLLLHSLLLTQPFALFSLANVENIHIDDFPRPSYNFYQEPVKSLYNMTDTEFYLNVWWDDILSLANKYNIKYTCYAIFNYDAKTRPSFDGRDFEYGVNNAFAEFIKRIIDNNFEVGLHGYNHQSLTLKPVDYSGWRRKKYLLLSLQEAAKLWGEVFPQRELPICYVAPMNVIDKAGKEALAKAFPTIKVISKYYSQEDQGARYQEFGPDPDLPQFFNIPRVTGGYLFDQERKNAMLNAINTFGVWTHFIHPDDIYGKYATGVEEASVYQEEQPADWQSLLGSMEAWFEFVRVQYPWLRNMTTQDAYYELSHYFNYKTRVVIKDNIVTLLSSTGSDNAKYFALRINDSRKISKIENCEPVYSYPDFNLHIFKTRSSKVRIELINE